LLVLTDKAEVTGEGEVVASEINIFDLPVKK
jgi:hypothetical protein